MPIVTVSHAIGELLCVLGVNRAKPENYLGDTNLIIHIAGGHFGEPRGRGAFALSLHKRVKPLVILVKPDFYSNPNANTYSWLSSTK